ncbi:LYAR-type C2HC zinc finger [Colletotrichum truncatum]|uniref:LYAR-type C2HC zinc finger n=1 Tax=Colletotrichum truncatum TaxID=5467 RepID=A0ACC3Z4V5_COLTU|nr:LYAR-type C2HC zinc finger [Colletotrichum truncatum]KAF6788681.1 LYAR-type C2HC zinc finger [Colletotrichum truncatum]
MVSFSCESCGDVLTKKKLDPHRNRCRGATYTCIDCMVYFPGTEYRSHTSCMSEAQKYQGALYKEKNNNNKKNNKANNVQPHNVPLPGHDAMAQPAYVEDVPEDVFETYEYQGGGSDDGNSPADLLPEAPTPPSANEGHVNVFDFLDASATPNASTLQLGNRESNEETQLVRYEASAYLDDSGAMVDEDPAALVQYGTGAIPLDPYETPVPKHERRRKDGSEKKDKKRKRLHVDTDQMMVDAPPTLAHSGLTGGLNRMMRPVFPPSPDFSGGDADPSPTSPLKKTKHSKHKKSEGGIGNNLLALMNINTSSKTKTKKRKVSSSTKKHSSHRHRDGEKAPKLIEYRPGSRDSKKDDGEGNQMVVYRPRADLFLSFVNKGPESERGCSMNKALKRFHRERSSSEDSLNKLMEEKELWRSLRMRRNERGEIVLFTA